MFVALNSRDRRQTSGKFCQLPGRFFRLSNVYVSHFSAIQRAGVVYILTAFASLSKTLEVMLAGIPKVISKKVDDLLSEYEWTPQEPGGVPTPYPSTLFQWLTAVTDSLALDPEYKYKAYEGITAYLPMASARHP